MLRGLRVPMVLIAVLALPMAWAVRQKRLATRQREAVAAIQSAGGWAHYDDRIAAFGRRTSIDPSRLGSLSRILGDDYFYRVRSVNLDFPTGDFRSAFARLADLEGLEAVSVQSSKALDFTDGDARLIARIQGLKMLNVSGSGLTDRGLEIISSLPELISLDLSRTAVTNEGLSNLARLSKLRELRLDWTNIDDRGLDKLAGLREMRELSVTGTYVGGEGLKHFDRLEGVAFGKGPIPGLIKLDQTAKQGLSASKKTLRRLDLTGIQLDDHDLEILDGLEALEELKIHMSISITETGWEHFGRLARLKQLMVFQSPCREGVPPAIFRLKDLEYVTFGLYRIAASAALPAATGSRSDGDAGEEFEYPRRLRTLTIPAISLSDNDLVRIARSEQLTDLTFSAERITPQGLLALAKSRTLLELALFYPSRDVRASAGAFSKRAPKAKLRFFP